MSDHFFLTWLDDLDVSSNSMRAYKADARHYVAWCKASDRAGYPFHHDVILQYIRENIFECTPATMMRRLATLRALADIEEEVGAVYHPQVRKVAKQLTSARNATQIGAYPVLANECRLLLNACTSLKERALVVLARETLLGPSELRQLTFGDTKSLSLSDSANQVIREIESAFGDKVSDSDQIINRGTALKGFSDIRGSGITTSSLRKMLHRIQSRDPTLAPLPTITFESFKLGKAIEAYKRTQSVEAAMTQTGWKNYEYAARMLEEGIKRLGATA